MTDGESQAFSRKIRIFPMVRSLFAAQGLKNPEKRAIFAA